MTQETVGFAALGIHPNVLAAIVAVGTKSLRLSRLNRFR